MREIFVESELEQFRCPPGFLAGGGEISLGEPLQGGRTRSKTLYMHRLLAPEELTQESLFVFRNWTARRCYPDPERPQSPLWWVVDGEPERFVLVDGERRSAQLTQIPSGALLEAWETNGPCDATMGEAEDTVDDDELPVESPGAGEWFVDSARVVLPVQFIEETPEEPEPSPPASPERREDPFKKSLDALLTTLTAPISVDPERQTRVAVRVMVPDDEADEGPIPLPSRPELVSEDFLAHSEVARPALAPIETRAPNAGRRFPKRTLAVLTVMLVAGLVLALLLLH